MKKTISLFIIIALAITVTVTVIFSISEINAKNYKTDILKNEFIFFNCDHIKNGFSCSMKNTTKTTLICSFFDFDHGKRINEIIVRRNSVVSRYFQKKPTLISCFKR